jgi:hypothetical protein
MMFGITAKASYQSSGKALRGTVSKSWESLTMKCATTLKMKMMIPATPTNEKNLNLALNTHLLTGEAVVSKSHKPLLPRK